MARTPPDRRLALGLELAALAGLVAIALGAVWGHQADDSATADEGIHLFAGAEYVSNGTYWMNLEHPPLAKLLAGLSLQPLGLSPPAAGDSREATPHNDYTRFLYLNRVPAHEVVKAARRPFPFLLATLVVLVWATARALAGPWAALLAAGVTALDPNLVAHAGVVHTDVGAALAMTATLVLFLAAARKGSFLLWVAAGVALGLALATKFTAVLLLPFLGVVPLLALLAEGAQRSVRGAAAKALGASAALAVALAVLSAPYAWSLRTMPDGKPAESVARFLEGRGATAGEVARYAALSRAFPPLGHWAAGLKGVALLSAGERENVNFFRGEVSRYGFLSYFPAAFALKSTPAVLLLVLAALAIGRRELSTYWVGGLLLMAAFYFAIAIPSSFNIGVRHLFPVYPLLAVAAATVLARRLPARLLAPAAAGLVLSSGASLASVHPLELGYFNFVLGGPERGAEWFADSNVDWGQDLKRLGDDLRAHGIEARTTIVAYGGLATNYYSRSCRLLEPSLPVAPGLYAVSDSMKAIGPEFLEGLEGKASADRLRELLAALRARGRRLRRVGASITIWELPPDPPPAAAPRASTSSRSAG